MPTGAGGTGAIGSDGIGGHVTELASGRNSRGGERCFAKSVGRMFFSCGVLTHTTDKCRTLDESFPFLPTGWQAERIGEQFILGPSHPARPQNQQMGNADCSGERCWSPGSEMTTDPNSLHGLTSAGGRMSGVARTWYARCCSVWNESGRWNSSDRD